MSQGTTVITLRIPDGLLDRLDRRVSDLNLSNRFVGYADRSDYIRRAIAEKLDHDRRSNRRRRRVPRRRVVGRFSDYLAPLRRGVIHPCTHAVLRASDVLSQGGRR